MKHLINEYWVVEIPEDAKELVIDMGYLIFKIMDMDPKKWTTDAEIEKDAKRFLKTGKSKFSELSEDYSMWITSGIPLTPGNWKLIGISDEMSEEQAARIVEPLFTKETIYEGGKYRYELDLKPMPFLNYLWHTDKDEGEYSSKATATESFQSLLKSKSLTKRYAIIQQIKTI